jgi:hypothetical protein
MTETNVHPPMHIVESTTMAIDTDALTQLTQDLSITPQVAAQTSVLIEERSNELYKGSHLPKWLDRTLHGRQPYNEGEGSVVRIAGRHHGQDLTAEEMNRTLVHEMEHVSQHDRKDVSMRAGNAIIWGLAAAGAVAGHEASKNRGKFMRLVLPLGLAAVSQRIGYQLAPHEREARARAQQITSTAIRRR